MLIQRKLSGKSTLIGLQHEIWGSIHQDELTENWKAGKKNKRSGFDQCQDCRLTSWTENRDQYHLKSSRGSLESRSWLEKGKLQGSSRKVKEKKKMGKMGMDGLIIEHGIKKDLRILTRDHRRRTQVWEQTHLYPGV